MIQQQQQQQQIAKGHNVNILYTPHVGANTVKIDGCTKTCSIKGCNAKCVVDHREHTGFGNVNEQSDDEIGHFCGKSHKCPHICSIAGYCGINVDTGKFKGQVGIKKPCALIIPPFQAKHEGDHICAIDGIDGFMSDQHHYCTKVCPGCNSICTKRFGHDGLHDTKHGAMINSIFISNDKFIEMYLKDEKTHSRKHYKFFTGQNALKLTCDGYCLSMGRGHTHLIPCDHEIQKLSTKGMESTKTQEKSDFLANSSTNQNVSNVQNINQRSLDNLNSRNNQSCPYDDEFSLVSTGKRHKGVISREYPPVDELLHNEYWNHIGFEDPTKADVERQMGFSRCRFKCKFIHKSNQSISERNKSSINCTRHVSHDQLIFYEQDYIQKICELAERFPCGSLTPSGHHFQCDHGYHTYMLIDCSKNMLSDDLVPSSAMKVLTSKNPFSSSKKDNNEEFKNRIGAATEICLRYFHLRYKLCSKDKMTVILFNKKNVTNIIENESVKYYYSLLDLILSNVKIDSSSPKYSKAYARVMDLMKLREKEDKENGIQPLVVMLSGGRTVEKKRRSSFQTIKKLVKSSSSSHVGTHNGASLSSSASSVNIQKILQWMKTSCHHHYQSSNSIGGNILIVKLGNIGDDSKLKQFILADNQKVRFIDDLKTKTENVTEPKSNPKHMSIEIRMILAQLMKNFEHDRCDPNFTIPTNEGGLLVRTDVMNNQNMKAGKVEVQNNQAMHSTPVGLSLSYQKSRIERDNLVKEILQTERTYVCNLSKALEMYYYPLTKHCSYLLSQKETTDIFSGLLSIYELHKSLLNQLENRLHDWHSQQKVADIFIELSPMFKIYTHYTTKYDMAVETFIQCREQRPAFNTFCEIRKKDPYSDQHALTSLMIMPIQRIPRYNLLLSGVMKNTAPSHPDYNNLELAVSQMADVGDYLNNKIKEREQVRKMKILSHSITGIKNLMQPDRHLLKEGFFSFNFQRQNECESPIANQNHQYECMIPEEKCFLFLFSDIMVHTSLIHRQQPKGRKYSGGSHTLGVRELESSDQKRRNSFNDIRDLCSAGAAIASSEFNILKSITANSQNDTIYDVKYACPLTRVQLIPSRGKQGKVFHILVNKTIYTYFAANNDEKSNWVSNISKSTFEFRKRKETFTKKNARTVEEAHLDSYHIYHSKNSTSTQSEIDNCKDLLDLGSPSLLIKEPMSIYNVGIKNETKELEFKIPQTSLQHDHPNLENSSTTVTTCETNQKDLDLLEDLITFE